MSGLFGALKGVWGGVVLLVAVAVVPALATGVAHWAHTRFDVGFWQAFFLALLLQTFAGLCALFGLASSVQKSHAERIGVGPEHRPGSDAL